MADELETVVLDNFPLPPIPGPLPATFFTDIPPGSAALFSTEFGKRAFRPLPNPVPVHAVRSGSEDDIRIKSCDLFTRYHSIAETIITPPTNWQDLYYYFDAFDLWTEGAGFLFHVLGYIVKVNVTKINYLEDFARKWSISNETRLANMVPHQDMLSSLQTPEDLASFDYCRMTSNDKEILNSVIRWHCEAFQKTRTPPVESSLDWSLQAGPETQRLVPAVNMAGPSLTGRESQKSYIKGNSNAPTQMTVEAQKAQYELSDDPYQHFGNPDHRISPRLAARLSQGRATHWESSWSQHRPVSNETYRNRLSNQYPEGQRGTIHGYSQQLYVKNSRRNTESNSFPLENYHNGANRRRQTAPVNSQLEHSQRYASSSKDPIYVLNPQKSFVGAHEEIGNVERSSSMRRSSRYSAHDSQGLSFQRRNSLGRRESMSYGNTISEDAGFYQNRKFDHVNVAPRSMVGNYFSTQARKISWPEVDFKKVCTIYVTGFAMEASAGEQLEKLFSECGKVSSISVVNEKFCAFVTFNDPGSALAAITKFDGHLMNSHKSLTVRYSKGTQKKTSPNNIDTRQAVFGSPARAFSHDIPPLSSRNRGPDGYDYQDPMRFTPPRSSSYTTSKSHPQLPLNTFEQPREGMVTVQATVSTGEAKRPRIESFGLSTNLKYSALEMAREDPSTTSHCRGPYIQGQLRTPEKRNNSIEQKAGNRHQSSNERSGPSTGKRCNGSESSKPQRKTPKKTKKPLSDRKDLTHNRSLDSTKSTVSQEPGMYSLGNGCPLASSGTAPKREVGVNGTSTILSAITQFLVNDHISNNPASTVRGDVKSLGDLSQYSASSLQMHLSTTNFSAKPNSITSTGLDSLKLPNQSSTAFMDTTQNNVFPRSKQTTESEPMFATRRDTTETPSESRKSGLDANIAARQQKKKYKHKKKYSDQSNTANASLASNNMFQTGLDDLPGNGDLYRSKSETRSHAKTDSSTTESDGVTTQVMLAKIEPSISHNQRGKEKADSKCDSPSNSTLAGHPGRQSHRSKNSVQAKANLGDDMFRNIQPAQLKPLEGPGYSSLHSKDEHGPSIPEPCKNNSSPKESRPSGSEESRTPTRKPMSRSRSKQVDQKHSAPNRKENKSTSPTPIEILSDPSNWPALGSTKSQLDTKSGNPQKPHSGKNPLSERTIPSVPIRRDSMASVVSQSTQIARCPTSDISNSPGPGASPLWPIVKRWDGYG